ncbi:MAG TPA: FecR domain-containing protein [Flavobacteriales bacterium]|nr:FecR domain-containing protein [Flavobacteriales bacterium]
MDQNGIDSELLARYVAGEADAWQRGRVEAWVALDRANAEELDRMQRIWSIAADAGLIALREELRAWDVAADALTKARQAEDRAWATGEAAAAKAWSMEDRAWAKVEARIAASEGKGRVIPMRRINWQRWLAAAAVLAGMLLAGRWILQPKTEHYAAASEHQEVLLADGSAILLSPGATLEARMGRERSIKLKGEAYFAVHRDEARHFVVDAGELEVTVLGTAFTVAAFDTADLIEVRVRSGRVRVLAGADSLVLTAGEHARYSRTRHMLERAPASPAEVWGWRILHFDSAPLDLVVGQLERFYKVRVSLKHSGLARCTLTAEFDDEPIEAILGVIADTFGLQLIREGNTYTLDGEGC